MFVGHYGVAFGARPATPAVRLWVYFIAVQWLDVVWSALVMLKIEKLRIVQGLTEGSSLDLYYMPYTHGLLGAAALSAALGAALGGGLLAAVRWSFRHTPPAQPGSRPDRVYEPELPL